jgi:hypothetical protein
MAYDGGGIKALKPKPIGVNGGQDRYRMRRRMSRLIGLTVGL